jgi:predicted small lipoprotein YifL
MADKSIAFIGTAALLVGALCACGQTGPLYLPDAPSDVVTRPADAPPPAGNTEAPNSPRTPDSPLEPPSPAPEVTAPEGTPAADPPDDSKKDKGAAPTPPR